MPESHDTGQCCCRRARFVQLTQTVCVYRNKFEQSLGQLSQFETHEAQVLMTEALEAMDMMNNAIVLQNEVRGLRLHLLYLMHLVVTPTSCCRATSQSVAVMCVRSYFDLQAHHDMQDLAALRQQP